MTLENIANIYGIEYIILYEDCPGYILFTGSNALLMIERIKEECYPIRNIEVSKKKSNGYEFDCCCSFSRNNNESMPEFTNRSCVEAEKFIRKILKHEDNYLFELAIEDFESEGNVTEQSFTSSLLSKVKKLFTKLLGK